MANPFGLSPAAVNPRGGEDRPERIAKGTFVVGHEHGGPEVGKLVLQEAKDLAVEANLPGRHDDGEQKHSFPVNIAGDQKDLRRSDVQDVARPRHDAKGSVGTEPGAGA